MLKAKCLLLVCLIVCQTPWLAHAQKSERPNVLFIAIDDLRPDLGCYGNDLIVSPAIERLAQEGMLFRRAYCQQAVCSPSRTSTLTGARPDTTKVWDLSTHFRRAIPDVTTLPQHFKNHGYFTQSLGKIYHSGLDDQLSWSVPSLNPEAPFGRPPQTTRDGATKAEIRGPAIGNVDVSEGTLHDGQLTEMALKALGEVASKKEPFFLGVGYIRPHLPFIAPPKYWELYDPAKLSLASNPFYPKDAPEYAIRRGPAELGSYAGKYEGGRVDDDQARQLIHGYYASVSFVDAQVGQLLAELDRLGLRDNTIVVLWGDHGWKLGEHDAWAKHSNSENDTRVPLLISAPGLKETGKKCNALVELVDIYPTLADLAGLPIPEHLEGKSFKPLLDQADQPWKKAVFSQYPRKSGKKDLMGYSMRTTRYRLTRWVDRKNSEKVDAIELYDHQIDPQENQNIAGQPDNKPLIEELTTQLLAGWKKENGPQGDSPSKKTVAKPANSKGQKNDSSNNVMEFWKMEFERENPLPPTLADVSYGPDKLQKLDFWKAKTTEPAPLVFFIHGGAWRANDKDRVSGLHAYLDAGISVVSINYRFVPAAQVAGVVPPVKWPMEDCARALQFVRSNAAKWNIDKLRIGASGGSAGACSSLWLAFHDDMADPNSSDPIARESTRVLCAGVVGAQTSLDPLQIRDWIPNASYGSHAFGFQDPRGKPGAGMDEFLKNRERLLPSIEEYSPYHWISADDPPIYLFYTGKVAFGKNQKDTAHTPNFGVIPTQRLQELGVECHFRHDESEDLAYPDPVEFLIDKLTVKK